MNDERRRGKLRRFTAPPDRTEGLGELALVRGSPVPPQEPPRSKGNLRMRGEVRTRSPRPPRRRGASPPSADGARLRWRVRRVAGLWSR
jgi:hypothetical protein